MATPPPFPALSRWSLDQEDFTAGWDRWAVSRTRTWRALEPLRVGFLAATDMLQPCLMPERTCGGDQKWKRRLQQLLCGRAPALTAE
eukprot:scaffold63_cov306-Pinguiococcus_pyrenoidosus.AAC.43